MKAIILAAGYGKRMLPLTEDTQKTLLSIAGRSIIDRILDGLRDCGIKDVCIVTGYHADDLRAHVLGHHPDLGFQFVHNERYGKTNNIYSMALAFDAVHFDSDLILIESDLIYEPAVLKRLLSSPRDNVAMVDHYRPGMDGTVVSLNSDSVITHVIPSSLQSHNFDFSDKYKTLNMYRFSREFCDTTFRRLLTYYATAIDDNCYYELVLGMLIYMQQAEIFAEIIDGEKWSEVDDPNDLRLAEFSFDTKSRYRFLATSCGGYWGTDVLDFAFIRNMYFPPPAMLSELRFQLPELLWNYGSKQSIVDTKLAWALRLPAQYVHALSGASQCYPWLRSWFGNRQVLVPDPTFGEYARIFPDAARYADRPGSSWSEIAEQAHDADVVVFVNPNNPTGTTLATNEIADFARSNTEKTIIVDESFIDFCGEPSLTQVMATESLDHVIVIKSLSKCLGVPGLRLGLLFTTDTTLAARVEEEMPIWGLNSVAENFLEAMLKHGPALEESFRRTIGDRTDLANRLASLAIVARVFPSGGNFVLAELRVGADEARATAHRLVEECRIYVKDVSGRFPGGRGHWRLAVRTPSEHARLCAAVNTVTPDDLPADFGAGPEVG